MHSEEWLRDKRMLAQEFRTLHDISLAKKDGKPKELISIKSTDKVKTAVELLNFRGFSQLPVIDDGVAKLSVTSAMIAVSDELHSDTAILAAMSAALDPLIRGYILAPRSFCKALR